MKRCAQKKLIAFILLIIFFFGVGTVFAADLLPADGKGKSPCPTGTTGNCGNYSLDDFVQLAINVSTLILGLTGSLALLAFVYGGFTFMLSSGSSEQVNKGKQILIGAVIGLVIVFTSYMIIGFVLEKSGFIAKDTSWANTTLVTTWFTNK
jgi:hypothetical protein